MEIALKTVPLPKLGMNVIAQETSLPKGSVRSAQNVVLDNVGQVLRRPGYQTFASLPDAHSLWQGNGIVLVAAGASLYRVNIDAGTVSAIFSGLPDRVPVEYSICNTDVYFCTAGVLGKITATGLVRKPGIASILGNAPTLAATTSGGLTAGRYGAAYSLVNDLGEESGLSSIAWVDVVAGGITISGLLTATHVVSQNIYVTTPGGGELYLHHNQPVAATAVVADQIVFRKATKQFLEPMPGGTIVRHFRGRTYVADGPWLWISEPLDYGLYNFKSGYMSFDWPITMVQPVVGGIFVGCTEKVVFLDGTGPSDFRVTPTSGFGAILHSGTAVPSYYFNPEVAPDQSHPVATWLTDVGIAVGRSNGSVVYPQSDRLRLSMPSARSVYVVRKGVPQVVFLGESLDFLGAVDSVI